MRIPSPLSCFMFLLAWTLVFPVCLSGQNPQGSLLVAVEDATGGRIAGAGVTIALEKSTVSRSGNTDAHGETRFDSLPPGAYTIAVRATGFVEKTSRVTVSVSSQATFAVILGPETLKQSVQVRDRGPSLATQPVETTSNTIKTVIAAEDLDEIPLSARSFANIALLSPFTAPVEPSDPTKARITAVSFGGSSGLNVDLSVDGGDNNDDYIGGFLQNYSPEAIEEFSVRTAQMNADTSRTNGGSVIISTRRGSNDWHGLSSLFLRATALNARNEIDNPEPDPKKPYSRQDGVFAIGGPIKRNKLWFFSSFEYVNEGASVAHSANSQTQFNALSQLASQGLIPGVNSIAVPTSVGVPFHDTLFTTRFDYAQSAKSQWFRRGC